jgi:hypothetical protein
MSLWLFARSQFLEKTGRFGKDEAFACPLQDLQETLDPDAEMDHGMGSSPANCMQFLIFRKRAVPLTVCQYPRSHQQRLYRAKNVKPRPGTRIRITRLTSSVERWTSRAVDHPPSGLAPHARPIPRQSVILRASAAGDRNSAGADTSSRGTAI